jgi:hypothetical protein
MDVELIIASSSSHSVNIKERLASQYMFPEVGLMFGKCKYVRYKDYISQAHPVYFSC